MELGRESKQDLRGAGTVEAEIQYDGVGRMKFHPDFHPKRGQPFTDEELCYLAKFYKIDGRFSISLALERPEGVIQRKYLSLKHNGTLEHYRKLQYY
jgi:hypothetical protein